MVKVVYCGVDGFWVIWVGVILVGDDVWNVILICDMNNGV